MGLILESYGPSPTHGRGVDDSYLRLVGRADWWERAVETFALIPPVDPEGGIVGRLRCHRSSQRPALRSAASSSKLCSQRGRIWEALGIATILEYAERFVGLRPRQTEERLRVAGLLEGLPLLDAALGEGILCYSAVREITRVGDVATEGAWIAAARGKTVGEMAGMVSGRELGDLARRSRSRSRSRSRIRFVGIPIGLPDPSYLAPDDPTGVYCLHYKPLNS